jgi:putative tricarboxylic transport membrane protein
MRKPGEIGVGICFLGIGIGFTIGAVQLQIGKPTEPQPGFFPFLGGVILIVLSALFLIQAQLGRAGETRVFGKLWRPGIVVLGLILYVATLEPLGYIIVTALLCAAILRVLETRFRVLFPLSLLLAVGSYILFDRLLGVTLPGGLMAKFW